jgi:hypothetical protein
MTQRVPSEAQAVMLYSPVQDSHTVLNTSSGALAPAPEAMVWAWAWHCVDMLPKLGAKSMGGPRAASQ